MSTHQRSLFQPLDRIPSEAAVDLTRRYNADPHPDKINLLKGTYRDDNGQPWVLPCVRLAKESMGKFNHEYLPLAGFKPFVEGATKLLFEDTAAFKENRVSQRQPTMGFLSDMSVRMLTGP